MTTAEIPIRKTWRSLYGDAFALIGPALVAGLLSGLIIGGVGGRMAMFLLRLTSDSSLKGLETDDEFLIGEFTSDTVFLLLVTLVMGAFGGLLYVGFREWTPLRWRALIWGVLGATIGGTLIIRPDGVDFTVIEPLVLAVALFVAIPGLYAVALSLLAERLLKGDGFAHSRWRWVCLLILSPLVLTGPVGAFFLLTFLLLVAANRNGLVGTVWRSVPVTWAGRAAVAVAAVASTVFLVKDVAAVL